LIYERLASPANKKAETTTKQNYCYRNILPIALFTSFAND